jgi:hypothetical protein
MSPSWGWLSASVIGSSHITAGMECQDNHLCKEIQTADGPVLIAVVSDGAGSATKSAVGSRLLCEVISDKTDEFFKENGKLEQINSRLIANWIQFFRDEIMLQAESDGVSDREYACTLVGGIIGTKESAFFQVGDGAIVYSSLTSEPYTLAFWPERGEYENTTFFVTQSSFLDQLQFMLVRETVTDLAALSDGLQRLALNYQARTAHPLFFSGLFSPLRNTGLGKLAELNTQLASFLASPKINERTDDDKTLVIAALFEASPASIARGTSP